MSARHDDTWQPVFCHRDDCQAQRDRKYCSLCGADIAAYLATATDEREAIRQEHSPTQPTQYTVPPAVRAPTGAPPVRPAPWVRDRFVQRAFVMSLTLGAAIGALVVFIV